ncbi:MAG: HD domain-containing protein, partial [Candidatus Limnocylindria bacterium]
MGVRHRAAQLWRFLRVERGDTRHAERTAAILRALGADEELVTAGLLHDVAKPAGTRLWHRVAGVLLARFAPAARARLTRGDSVFARYLDHPR